MIKQAVIFAGGKGTRLSEQTKTIPKPMVYVNGEPIIIHIMRNLANNGISKFLILTGYLSDYFIDYFSSKLMGRNDLISFNNDEDKIKLDIQGLENCEISFLYTGEDSGTASRLFQAKRKDLLEDEFVLTYGDTYSTVDIREVYKKHKEKKDTVLTLTGISYTERFGLAKLDDDGNFLEFKEKSTSKNEVVNGGYMCVNKNIFNYYDNLKHPDDFMKDIMSQQDLWKHISIYKYDGYWQPVDTQRDLDTINKDFKRGII